MKPILRATVAAAVLSAGLRQTCGVTADGGVYCWGGEQYGEKGDGWIAPIANHQPVRVRTR